jgi:hypothetical protein
MLFFEGFFAFLYAPENIYRCKKHTNNIYLHQVLYTASNGPPKSWKMSYRKILLLSLRSTIRMVHLLSPSMGECPTNL